ncbi:uncharacterized protein LOC131649499 [Vicia villosa]|uniref:uncharacterized protein LOC131649499 n=1 Tax=Vicia villosa TaxID=3911 RepID=UPI00273B9249|nr:uncharacterized protein LOC131649499 [Vicia villosa]
MVDFDNLQEHNFNIKNNMLVQGWEMFFDRLIGPVYPELVKEFWIHATLTPKAILSFVLGKEISITENLIKRLLNLEGYFGAAGAIVGRTDWDAVYAEIFTSRESSKNIKDLKPPYRIWDKILLGCIYHRKASVSPNYMNQDQQYILYCIGKGQRVDLPYILFIHMWNHVKESREQARLKSQKIKRNIIPLGRLISDILTETGIVQALLDAGTVKDLEATYGSTMNSHTLKKMKLIQNIASPPRVLFFKNEHPNSVLFYLESCLKDGYGFDPAWLSDRVLPSIDNLAPSKKKKEKRKSTGDGPLKPLNKKKKTSEHQLENQPASDHPVHDTIKVPRSSESIRKLIDDIENIDTSILHDGSEPKQPPKTTKQSSKSQPSGSTKSKGKQPLHSFGPILNPQPLNTIFPALPNENIFSSAQPTHSEPPPSETQPQPTSPLSDPQPEVDISVYCNFSDPSSPSSTSSDCVFCKPRPSEPTPQNPSYETVVVVLDSDNEAESTPLSSTSNSSILFERPSEPYLISNPEELITIIRTTPPLPSIDMRFQLLKHKVRTRLDYLKVAYDSKLDHVAARKLWKSFFEDVQTDFLDLQNDCLAAAPGPSGLALEYGDGIYFHPIVNWKPLEEAPFVDEMELDSDDMDIDNPLPMIVWTPKKPLVAPKEFVVLTGDMETLFDWFRRTLLLINLFQPLLQL